MGLLSHSLKVCLLVAMYQYALLLSNSDSFNHRAHVEILSESTLHATG